MTVTGVHRRDPGDVAPAVSVTAEKEGVEIRLYTVIYEAINEMREAMEGLLAPTYRDPNATVDSTATFSATCRRATSRSAVWQPRRGRKPCERSENRGS